MNWLWISMATIFVLGFTFYVATTRGISSKDFWESLCGLLIISVVGGAIIGAIIASVVSVDRPIESYTQSTEPLHVLYDGTDNIYVGCMTSGRQTYYTYNLETSGGVTSDRLNKYLQNVFLAEDGADDPRIERTCERSVDQSNKWFFASDGNNCYYTLHIPVGGVDTSCAVR